ncbi:hypothetical protein INT08_07205 [Prosthecochloris sp. N3]|uniref:CRISPR-associated protein Csh1 n=1 Tax=Prosthecochloris ethylica TaxID=2743976 RepID=A0ABR9XSC1_9CHLB|nr:hypothetical protein [Prosthecochloris ethylica]MBF0586689.1 hypothetical protein [Prosthecochloris ethylica]MBF0636957.1 hypothetical protein [Prosthecochloris ethylica]NUK47828.1 hypothetical protein [Prosthecochloris ethylica]
MLETLLQIGKTFREAGRLKHHRYIKPAPVPKKNTTITFLSLPVREDFSFDFDSIKEIPENERSSLYYLTYQTSDSDSSIKTLFGDIYHFQKKENKEGGNYRSLKFSKYSSVKRADEHAALLESDIVRQFRVSLIKNLDKIEDVLNLDKNIYLHFDFDGQNWFELDDGKVLDEISDLMVSKFATQFSENGQWAFDSMLYRSICSGDAKNDIQFPYFDKSKKYRSVGFAIDDIKNLFYAVNYSENALITERDTKSDIKIIILPKGDNLSSDDLEAFSEQRISEDVLNQISNNEQSFDECFSLMLSDANQAIVEFDVIFCKVGGNVDSDVLEISAIKKSFLHQRFDEINAVKRRLGDVRSEEFQYELKPFKIIYSFMNILNLYKKTQSRKYQNHLFKVLPKIYTGTYYNDDVLLPAFIEKTEFNIRNDQGDYNLLKYDYYFLNQIQNSITDKIMEMENCSSYQAGLLLGKMAKPLAYKINSFEKNYVGLLSRRISDKRGLIEFSNFINEKLAIHDVAYPDLQKASVELASVVGKMNEKDYLKNECAFGFFESFFKYES